MRILLIAFFVLLALAAPIAWPHIDIVVSDWFYRPGEGFFLATMPLFDAVHLLAHAGARILAFAFILLIVMAVSQRRPVAGLDAKGWLFLLLSLLIGPGLIANVVLKDHSGRARPREIVEFGGSAHFTPALVPSNQCDRNCSFVSGDGAFGFYLTAFAYMIPVPRSREYFWGGMGVGSLFALARIAAGAHFLSDNVYAAIFMLIVLAVLHGIMCGWQKTWRYWRAWLFLSPKGSRLPRD